MPCYIFHYFVDHLHVLCLNVNVYIDSFNTHDPMVNAR